MVAKDTPDVAAKRKKVEVCLKVEESVAALYMETQEKTNAARLSLAKAELHIRGIELNKTRVYARNYNDEETRVIVRELTDSGKAVCFEIDANGNCVKPNRQAACCDVSELRIINPDMRQ